MLGLDHVQHLDEFQSTRPHCVSEWGMSAPCHYPVNTGKQADSPCDDLAGALRALLADRRVRPEREILAEPAYYEPDPDEVDDPSGFVLQSRAQETRPPALGDRKDQRGEAV